MQRGTPGQGGPGPGGPQKVVGSASVAVAGAERTHGSRRYPTLKRLAVVLEYKRKPR